MAMVQSDEELSIAIGYANHLYVDVIAHHHFVPAHESMWHKNEVLTHVISEWAMDAHLEPLLDTTPKQLLLKHKTMIAPFISVHFRCTVYDTNIALQSLAFLRWSIAMHKTTPCHLQFGQFSR